MNYNRGVSPSIYEFNILFNSSALIVTMLSDIAIEAKEEQE